MPEIVSVTVTVDLAEDDDRSESQEAVLRERAVTITQSLMGPLESILTAAFEDEGAVNVTFES